MSFKKIYLTIFTLALLVISPLTTFSTYAQDTAPGVRAIDGIAVQPSDVDNNQPLTRAWFIQNMKPGESVERTALISNLNDKEKVIMLSPEDRIQNTDQFTFSDKETLKDVGTWITLSNDKVTIPAQKATEVKFTIKVPEGTAPGEYAGVLAVQEIKPAASGSGFNVINRVGARVYITVPGELKVGTDLPTYQLNTPTSTGYQDFVRSNFMQSYDTVFLGMQIKNTGNIFEKVKGTIEIQTPTDKVNIDFDRDFAPNENPVNIPAFLTKAKWQVGKYKATFTFENTAVITFNKTDVKDISKTKTYTTEFEMTADTLATLKKDFETTKANRPKSSDPVTTSKTDAANNVSNTIKEATPEPAKTDSTNNNGLLIGLGISGGVIILGLIGAVAFLIWKQRKDAKGMNKSETKSDNIMPIGDDKTPKAKK